MAKKRLPNPGKDEGVWGSILNDYLRVSHDDTGGLYVINSDTDRNKTFKEPVEGQVCFNKEAGQFQRYNGKEWENISENVKASTLGSAAFKNIGASPGDVVVMDTDGKLPTIDGSKLQNVPTGQIQKWNNVAGRPGSVESGFVGINLETGQMERYTGTEWEILTKTNTVNTIAELKNMKPQPVVLVDVDGYAVKGDGGGGQFFWDATSSATDNGGTVIASNITGTGRWIRKNNTNFLNAKWFGVVGDGVTDDTTAIQRALDAIPATGGTLVFTAGDTMYITRSLRPNSNTSIEGNGATLKAKADGWNINTDGRGMFLILGTNANTRKENIEIKRMQFIGSQNQDINFGIKMIYWGFVRYITIDSCTFKNHNWEGIWGTNSADEFVTIKNNYFYQVGYPNSFVGLPSIQCNLNRSVITNNYIERGGVGIGLSGNELVCSNNIVKGFIVNGISTGDTVNVNATIVGNLVIDDVNPTTLGVTGQNGKRPCYATVGATAQNGVVLSGNTALIKSNYNQSTGIALRSMDGNEVSNNNIIFDGFTGTDGVGVYIEADTANFSSSEHQVIRLTSNRVSFQNGSTGQGFLLYSSTISKVVNIVSQGNLVELPAGSTANAYNYNFNNATGSLIMSGDQKTAGLVIGGQGGDALNMAAVNKRPIFVNYATGTKWQGEYHHRVFSPVYCEVSVPTANAAPLFTMDAYVGASGGGTGLVMVTIQYYISFHAVATKAYLISSIAPSTDAQYRTIGAFHDSNPDDGVTLALQRTGGVFYAHIINNTGNTYLFTAAAFPFQKDAALTEVVPHTTFAAPAIIKYTGKDNNFVLGKTFFGAAAPTTTNVYYNRGDIVFNNTPSAGGKAGWICVTAGTPGTWKTFGAIDL